MKKINFTAGFILLALTMCFSVNIVKHVGEGDGWSITSVLVTILMACASAVYFYMGVWSEKKEKEKMAKLVDSYETLMELYEEMKDDENPNDKLSRQLFVKGVHDFSTDVFEIIAGIYPSEMQKEADEMLDNLMKRAAEFM